MSDELLSSPYADLVRQVLAGEVEPEAAAVEAFNLMEKVKSATRHDAPDAQCWR
jgi:hypothetical protein